MDLWIIYFVLFPVFTLLYLAIAVISLIYFYLGIAQAITNGGRYDQPKRTGGIVSLIISLAVLTAASYFYFKWIWLW
jgi:hypothetical protein